MQDTSKIFLKFPANGAETYPNFTNCVASRGHLCYFSGLKMQFSPILKFFGGISMTYSKALNGLAFKVS
jgi:hypothetical protein